MSDREFFAHDLARHAVLTPHVAKLGLPEGAEVTSLYMLNSPWEDWGMTAEGETRSEGITLTLTIHYLINGEADYQLSPFRQEFEADEALAKNDLIIEFLLDKIGANS